MPVQTDRQADLRALLQYDFKAFLDAGADTVAESQEQTAREMYRLLSSIPLDHLAANGESMVSWSVSITSLDHRKLNHLLSLIARESVAYHSGSSESIENAGSIERRSEIFLEHV